jgi:hypothetical protein
MILPERRWAGDANGQEAYVRASYRRACGGKTCCSGGGSGRHGRGEGATASARALTLQLRQG